MIFFSSNMFDELYFKFLGVSVQFWVYFAWVVWVYLEFGLSTQIVWSFYDFAYLYFRVSFYTLRFWEIELMCILTCRLRRKFCISLDFHHLQVSCLIFWIPTPPSFHITTWYTFFFVFWMLTWLEPTLNIVVVMLSCFQLCCWLVLPLDFLAFTIFFWNVFGILLNLTDTNLLMISVRPLTVFFFKIKTSLANLSLFCYEKTKCPSSALFLV